MLGCWEGYKWSGSFKSEKPWFAVRKESRILRRYRKAGSCWEVRFGCDNYYRIVGMDGKSRLKIVDMNSGQLLAEVCMSNFLITHPCMHFQIKTTHNLIP